jgi:hypothetical protein
MGEPSFPTAPSRVACLPEYFMYYNYLKRLGTRLDFFWSWPTVTFMTSYETQEFDPHVVSTKVYSYPAYPNILYHEKY